MITSEVFVDTIERQLADLMPEQHAYERLDWARKIAACIEDDMETAIDEESDKKVEEKSKDAHDEGFDEGAKAERLLFDEEIREAFEKGYKKAECDLEVDA